MVERGLGKFRGAYLETRIFSILVRGAAILDVGMERSEGDAASVGSSWESICGRSISAESLGIGSTQVAVLEDSSTLKFSDSIKNSWELYVSAEGDWNGGLFDITAEIPLGIPDVAPLIALEVCLSEALALLRISYGSETGVTGGPLGFALVLGLLEATLFQWILQINYYNQNSVQTLSIIKAGSMSSPREAELQSPLPENDANLLSLQETPLGCSSRIPGNLKCF